MKFIFRLILIFFIYLFVSNQIFANNSLEFKNKNIHYPTQADMLNYSNKSIEDSDKNFELICKRIVENFKSDKSFIYLFNLDKSDFLKYRLIQRDLILPHIKTDSTD